MTIKIILVCIVAAVIAYLVFTNVQLRKNIRKYKPIINMVENARDIHYHYVLNHGGYYKFLSKNLDGVLGEGSYEEHLNNPQIVYDIVHPDDLAYFRLKEQGKADFCKPMRYRLRHKDGHYVWLEEHVTPIMKGDKVQALHGIYRDISEQMALREALNYKLTHDSLTDVYNRTFFDDLFKKYNEIINERVGFIICDLDKLKKINDEFGHSSGDEYIKNAGEYFKRFEQKNSYLARIGGDEFVYMLIGDCMDEIETIAEKITKSTHLFSGEGELEFSIGHAYTKESKGNLLETFKCADRLMYENKYNRCEAREDVYILGRK